jgi:beta-phosphoglucomutase-like phosphatase (HAD superfamily)
MTNCGPGQPVATNGKLSIPEGDFKAYLFDCDGTIVNSMPLHHYAWTQTLAHWNCEYPEELFYQWGGLPISEIAQRLSEMYSLDLPIEEICHRKESLYYENLARLEGIPEVIEQIELQHGHIPFAVVSGGRRITVEASLRTLGLLDKFDTLVCAGDYTRSKPNGEPFLIAAQRLGVAPESCLVFEDTQLGVDAAIDAGMSWVRVEPPLRP